MRMKTFSKCVSGVVLPFTFFKFGEQRTRRSGCGPDFGSSASRTMLDSKRGTERGRRYGSPAYTLLDRTTGVIAAVAGRRRAFPAAKRALIAVGIRIRIFRGLFVDEGSSSSSRRARLHGPPSRIKGSLRADSNEEKKEGARLIGVSGGERGTQVDESGTLSSPSMSSWQRFVPRL